MNFGKIKEIREYFDKTQQEIANVLNVSRSTYAGWENALDSIPLLKLIDFCDYFGISLDYICDLSKVKKSNYNIDKDDKIDMSKIGLKLKEIRLNNNDTQEKVATSIGIDQSTYSRYEQGQTMITTYELIEFAKYYNISINYICCKSNNMNIE